MANDAPLVFLDVETTGLDYKTCSIIQLSGIIKVVGKEEVTFDYRIRPYKNDTISEIAAEKTGLTQDIIMQYPEVGGVVKEFKALLDSTLKIEGSNRIRRAYFVGYNSQFDMDFVRDLLDLNGSNFKRYFYFPDIDVMRLYALYFMCKRGSIKSFKLTDIYEAIFEEELVNAHDALADVQATKKLYEAIFLRYQLNIDMAEAVKIVAGENEQNEEEKVII